MMIAKFTSFLESDFFDRLRTLTNLTSADSATMYKVADYINWAIKNQNNLLIDLTDEDKRLVRLAGEVS